MKYRGADKSLARSDWKKPLKGRHFSSHAEVIAAAETWLDGQISDFFFFSGLQKFGRCSLFSSLAAPLLLTVVSCKILHVLWMLQL